MLRSDTIPFYLVTSRDPQISGPTAETDFLPTMAVCEMLDQHLEVHLIDIVISGVWFLIKSSVPNTSRTDDWVFPSGFSAGVAGQVIRSARG